MTVTDLLDRVRKAREETIRSLAEHNLPDNADIWVRNKRERIRAFDEVLAMVREEEK